MIGRSHRLQGTPAWLLGQQLIAGLRPATEFERLADELILPRAAILRKCRPF
jgi:hypothetical protein